MSEKQPSLFVVDDEKIIAETLTRILQQHGFAVTTFTDPQKALIAARSSPPDLLLTDVMMPQLSGVDLAIQIKAEFPECKILLFSGQGGTADLLEKAVQMGYNFTLLTKPLHPTELLRVIRAQDPTWVDRLGSASQFPCE